jgi:hypothetical protein
MALRTRSRTVRPSKGRNRAALDKSIPRNITPALIDSIAATAATTIRITFAGRVQPSKTPVFYKAGAGGAMTVTTMNRISDTVIELVFSGTVAGTDLIIEEGDLGIRTAAGGFVPAGTYAIPTFP